MLSRVYECNDKISKMQADNGEQWSLNDEMILLGSDVKSLFPSMSAEMTGKCLRRQFSKSPIEWVNIDWKLLTLYVKMHENYWKNGELSEVLKYLPEKVSNIGRPPSIGTIGLESKFRWPSSMDLISNNVKKKLMGFAMEVAVCFFFRNFTYTFGGDIYVQVFGGPIGARITMAVAKLVMQDWKDHYDQILENSGITELLTGLYVDDGRTFQRKLKWGESSMRTKINLHLTLTLRKMIERPK